MEYLSNIQLYFSEELNLISDETEVHHIQKVMRHNIDDIIYVTDGKGTILKSKLTRIGKSEIIIEEIEKYQYENILKHISLCIPLLKNPDRFTFAIEKTIELGFTNFIIYQPKISTKKEFKKERIEKLGIAAMKQSLRSFIPKFEFIKEINQLNNPNINYFDQNGEENFLGVNILTGNDYTFVFGGESGFSSEEYRFLKNHKSYKLTPNRLRSETAIIAASTLIAMNQ